MLDDDVTQILQKLIKSLVLEHKIVGTKKKLIISGDKISIVFEDQFGVSSEYYDDIDTAVYDFVELIKVYGL